MTEHSSSDADWLDDVVAAGMLYYLTGREMPLEVETNENIDQLLNILITSATFELGITQNEGGKDHQEQSDTGYKTEPMIPRLLPLPNSTSELSLNMHEAMELTQHNIPEDYEDEHPQLDWCSAELPFVPPEMIPWRMKMGTWFYAQLSKSELKSSEQHTEFVDSYGHYKGPLP